MARDQASPRPRQVKAGPGAGRIGHLARRFVLPSLVAMVSHAAMVGVLVLGMLGMLGTACAPGVANSADIVAEEAEDFESAEETRAHVRASRRPSAGAGPLVSRIRKPSTPLLLMPQHREPAPRTWHRPRRPAPDDDDDDDDDEQSLA